MSSEVEEWLRDCREKEEDCREMTKKCNQLAEVMIGIMSGHFASRGDGRKKKSQIRCKGEE